MADALIVVAAAFAVVAGANDGSSMLSAGVRVPGLRPVWSLAVLLAAIVVGPWALFGTRVATTFAHQLVPFQGPEADRALLVAAAASMVVVFALTRAGLPTSLTLSLIGAVTGAGIGADLPVRLGVLVTILAFGLCAPLVAAAVAYGASRWLSRSLSGRRVSTRLRHLHIGAFSLQCLAYSANGGQKMLAVFALTAGATSSGMVRDPWWLALSVAGLFALGVALGLRKVSAKVGTGILAVHLRHAVVAELCTFALVMAAGLGGVPVTASQSLAGGLVGAGASESRSRVRWPVVGRLVGAWVVTLPASVGLAALASALWRLAS
ncbi:MAG: inorganic phosphate transporter [Actinomycetota bacterium]|nr:inorganic phosphate transporter [Actinomycetota bacterium]